MELFDRDTHQPLAGLIRVEGRDGRILPLPELHNRGEGVGGPGPIHNWWVLPQRSHVRVPADHLKVVAVSGLDTEMAEFDVDLTGKQDASIRVPLTRFYNPRKAGLLAGNTHLHLKGIGKEDADRYLRDVPRADGLDIVFVSYLERAIADRNYISNRYTREELGRLSAEQVRFGHGEEMRHNFGSYGEGYGHILLLDLPHLVRPVSVGPGLTNDGTDSPPLRDGIQEARGLGGKVIWAHNRFGFEDIPNWIAGRVHANNIFDSGSRGSYKDSYYRYLNIGRRAPFSTGTDWFIYDYARVYVPSKQRITPKEWLDLLADGRSYITNGPFLEFTVNGRPIGTELALPDPGPVAVHASAKGRIDFHRIELIRNGEVVATSLCRPAGNHFVASMEEQLTIHGPCWLAMRTPPPPVEGDPELQEPVETNELGGPLFSHTSPIYVSVAGQNVFDDRTAAELVDEMKDAIEMISSKAVFANPSQRDAVVQVYRDAIATLQEERKRRAQP